MKHKFLSFALMVTFGSTMLFSCQNSEEPVTPPSNDLKDSELVEYTISATVPDEIRTRAAEGEINNGTNFYEITQREINKLWYAVYYQDELIYNNEITRLDEEPFEITYKSTSYLDPAQLFFFFWAGNENDNIQTYTSKFDPNYIPYAILYLNYGLKNVQLMHRFFSSQDNAQLYDSFAGYYQFAEIPEISPRKKTVTLKRPFAEIFILADDFIETDLKEKHPNGLSFYSFFGKDQFKSADTSTRTLPLAWEYANDNYLYVSEVNKPNGYTLDYDGFQIRYFNDFTHSDIPEIKFKERKFDYYGHFLTFPVSDEYIYLTLAYLEGDNMVKNGQDRGSGSQKISIPMPSGGIKANNRYIFYNKSRKDGGKGFLEGDISYSIEASPSYDWENDTPNENETESI